MYFQCVNQEVSNFSEAQAMHSGPFEHNCIKTACDLHNFIQVLEWCVPEVPEANKFECIRPQLRYIDDDHTRRKHSYVVRQFGTLLYYCISHK